MASWQLWIVTVIVHRLEKKPLWIFISTKLLPPAVNSTPQMFMVFSMYFMTSCDILYILRQFIIPLWGTISYVFIIIIIIIITLLPLLILFSLIFFYISVYWWFSIGVWVTASLQDSSQYSNRSQQCYSLDSLHLTVISTSFSPCTNP